MICKLPTRENRPTQLPNLPTQTGDEPIKMISLLELQGSYRSQYNITLFTNLDYKPLLIAEQ